MSDFLEFIVVMGGLLLLALLVICGLVIGNAAWNCSSYKEAETKMIAGTCYVKAPSGRWITFDTYVHNVHDITIEQK